ncbi:MAG: hypothetical protein QM484_01905 [Woeseiaceae bacterium]
MKIIKLIRSQPNSYKLEGNDKLRVVKPNIDIGIDIDIDIEFRIKVLVELFDYLL